MKERYVTVVLQSENEVLLKQAADALADKIDDAMKDQELPVSVEFTGVEVIDPDEPEEAEIVDGSGG